MEFLILGPLEVRVDGRPLNLGGLTQRRVLAALLLSPNRTVELSRLVETAWDDAPPTTARRQVQNRIAALRTLLTRSGGVINTDADGYSLRVTTGQLDAWRFDELVRQAADASRPEAAELLREALALWRGPALAGLGGNLLRREAQRYEDSRLTTLEDFLELQLATGAPEAVAELEGLVAEHPLRERLVGPLILGLHRAGRQADALAAYRDLSARLADELGIDPSPRLRELYEAVQRRGPALMSSAADGGLASPRIPGDSGGTPRPAQLPADVSAFTGRVLHLASLDTLLSDQTTQRAVVISAIAGTAGVGKTALAVHWAHRVRDKFPDGQLYVNLRGFAGASPLRPVEALAGFLRALGVPPSEVPTDIDVAAGRYRSILADKRALIILDNAATADQVRPLLPGSPACLVVVTSRNALDELIAQDGARRLALDILGGDEAGALLAHLLGADRVAAEPAAVVELARLCGRLPLALRIAAELAAARTDTSLAELVAELADHQQRLDLLDAGGDPRADVRAVFSWSYQHLPAAAAHAFRLLGVHPGVSMQVDAVAALTGSDAHEARRLLGQLARASLIHASGGGHYGMHDLLRVYAAELAVVYDSPADRKAALTRLFDHYLASSVAAMNALYPVATPTVGDPEAARSWIEAERSNLAAACTYGAAHGWQRHAIALAETLFRYLDAGGPVTEAVTVTASAAAAAAAVGDRDAQARALTNLGRLHRRQGQLDRAAQTYRQALSLYAGLGDRASEAGALRNLGSVYWRQGHYRQAADHYQRAWTLYRQLGDEAGQADALVRLGLVDERLGQVERAAGRLQPALELFARLGDRFSEAYVLSLLARLRRQPDQLDLAAVHLEQSLAAIRQAGDRTREAYALTDLAAVHARRGRLSEAAGHLGQALVLHRRIGDRASEAEAINDLGQVLRAVGNAAEARTQHGEALNLAREIGDRYEQARAHDGIAATYQITGDLDRARPHLEHAQRLFTDLAVPAAPTLQVPAAAPGR
jgi:DNA-binding SARP family transcriptional activator